MKLNLKHLNNLNVLYVEDDCNISQQTIDLLNNFFNKTFHTQNAEEALEILEDKTIHILITDIELPNISGLKLCEEIRKTNQNMPIFITTAHDDSNTLKKAIKLNLVDFLVKPINIELMTNALLASLEKLSLNSSLIINQNTVFNPLSGELVVSDFKIHLSKNELMLLTLLTEYKNQLVHKDTIAELLYPDEYMSDAAYKNIIYRLRKKIGKESLNTVINVGVKLNVDIV